LTRGGSGSIYRRLIILLGILGMIALMTATAAAVCLVGAVYLLLAAWAVRRFARIPIVVVASPVPVTVLKPLHGKDAWLYENLRSFCTQRHPRFQIIFGVRDPVDPATAVVRRLIAELPERDLALVVDPSISGNNFKVSNLENMVPVAKHDIFVVADSDMRVGPDYLAAVTAPLSDAATGLVTCLYRGQPVAGLPSRLGAMFVNYGFLPSALVGERLRPGNACFGATMALRRDIYATIGGFASLRDQLADDYALGAAVHRAGKRVVLSPQLVDTIIAEPDFATLLRHELRWARTIRLIAPLGYAASFITHPLALSLLACIALGIPPLMLGVLAAVLVCRLTMVRVVDRALGLPAAPLWLVPLRDLLSFAVFVASFLGNRVTWRDTTFRIAADGRLATIGDDRA
jgi:ceramide glucosyltransferase